MEKEVVIDPDECTIWGRRKKIRVSIILICVLFVLPIFGEKLTTFPQLHKPEFITVGDNLICINEGAVVFLYDFNDFKLIKKFVKRVRTRENSPGI